MTDRQLIELNKIPGNEFLKRAIDISLNGRHTITVIGNSNNGLENLETVFENRINEQNSWLFNFISPCPCGNFEDNLLVCNCSTDTILEHIKTPQYKLLTMSKIIVRLLTPMFSDYLFDKNIDKQAIELLRTAFNKFHFTVNKMNKIVSVAKTIANMDSSKIVMAWHITEAIQYQIPFNNDVIFQNKI